MSKSLEDVISLVNALKDNVAAKQQQIEYLSAQLAAEDSRAHNLDCMLIEETAKSRVVCAQRVHNIASSWSKN